MKMLGVEMEAAEALPLAPRAARVPARGLFGRGAAARAGPVERERVGAVSRRLLHCEEWATFIAVQ